MELCNKCQPASKYSVDDVRTTRTVVYETYSTNGIHGSCGRACSPCISNLGTHRHRELCCEHIGDGLSEEIIPQYVDNNSEESCTIASKHALTPRAGHLTHYHLDTYHPIFTLNNSRGGGGEVFFHI